MHNSLHVFKLAIYGVHCTEDYWRVEKVDSSFVAFEVFFEIL